MPVVNLRENWIRLFGNIEDSPSTTAPIDIPKQPEVVVQKTREQELDLVVDTRPKVSKTKASPEDWKQVAELSNETGSEIVSKPKTRRKAEPIMVGNKCYVSNGTAIWAQVRKKVYPLYKEFCIQNGHTPNISDFNKLLAQNWSSLSAEDKVKASAKPEDYFIFG